MITNLNLTLAKEGGKKIKVTIKTQQQRYLKVPLKKSIFTETHLGTIIHFCVVTLKENIESLFPIVLVHIENVPHSKLTPSVNSSAKNTYMFCMKFLFA